MSSGVEWVEPDWPAPPRVRVLSTFRRGGMSEGPYASLNLADHVGDRAEHVAANRRQLRVAAGLPAEPLWLKQVHGREVVTHTGQTAQPPADGSVAFEPGRVCAVMTADCLPVVLTDRAGSRVAVAHAGWRGLLDGVLGATVRALAVDPSELLAWLGPAIAADAFEVGTEVRDAFAWSSSATRTYFRQNDRGRFQADLYGLARALLGASGVASVWGGGWCTASDRDRFYSYRRDGRTGRMATLAWLA